MHHYSSKILISGNIDQAQTEGKALGGPRGYQEVGCGTVSFYDAEGNRLLTRRLAQMPEAKKASLYRANTAVVGKHGFKVYQSVAIVICENG